MIPSTADRVPNQTSDKINEQIRRQTWRSLAHYGSAGPEAIDRRLAQLDQEWDIERTLETNASIALLLGVTLGTFVDKRFFALPAVVGGFLLQHAIQGWCPPLPVFRRLGFRTQAEIEQERYALKAMRGDFGDLGDVDKQRSSRTAALALKAVER